VSEKQNTRVELFLGEFLLSLRECPGGVTKTEVLEILARLGFGQDYQLESVLASVPNEVGLWEERDEDGEVWFHMRRPEDRHRKVFLSDKKDSVAMVRIDSVILKEVKKKLIDQGGNLKGFVEAAVREKLTREARK